MQTVEIWPKDIELGDAVGEGLTVTYLRMTDPESGLDVIAFIRPEALQTLADQFRSAVAAKANPH
ncbi:hypothetical protein [Sphingomonas sp. 2378]|uniref:hypothetical protein n=1 Tax=Sphingomonas sp. 2378 TaxID=1219748 RepID=UPI00311B0A49